MEESNIFCFAAFIIKQQGKSYIIPTGNYLCTQDANALLVEPMKN